MKETATNPKSNPKPKVSSLHINKVVAYLFE